MRFLVLRQVVKSEPSCVSSSLDLYGKFNSEEKKMPVNVGRFCTSVLLAFTAFGVTISAQTQPQQTPHQAETQAAATQPQTVPIKAPSASEIMRDRISKAKAFIAVRNYNAAIYELENIRRETSDQSVQAVTTVLLMNSYLEQGDYKRAQDFLTQAFNIQKTTKPGAADIYNAIAGQVIKGARTKVERYKSLGLVVADRNLPLEAVTDVERMRETVELVITQAKEMGRDAAKTNTAMALLEEATNSRSALARDDYDARKWRDEVADSREQLANSRSVITNAVDGTTSPNTVPMMTAALNSQANQTSVPVQTAALTNQNVTPTQTVAMNNPTVPPASLPAVSGTAPGSGIANPSGTRDRVTNAPVQTETAIKPSDTLLAAHDKPSVTDQHPTTEEPAKPIVAQNPPETRAEPVNQGGPAAEMPKTEGPMDVGSLLAYATKQTPPVYPPAARSMRASGVVRVEVTVDESGQVAEVQKTSGPPLLQTAAKDAVRKWRFKPFMRDGQPVRAVGFVNFNFSL
jgi:TonB family protein